MMPRILDTSRSRCIRKETSERENGREKGKDGSRKVEREKAASNRLNGQRHLWSNMERRKFDLKYCNKVMLVVSMIKHDNVY